MGIFCPLTFVQRLFRNKKPSVVVCSLSRGGVRKVPGMSEHMGLVEFGVKNRVISVGCFGETS